VLLRRAGRRPSEGRAGLPGLAGERPPPSAALRALVHLRGIALTGEIYLEERER